MIRKFWWGNGETKKIHWVKWSSLCSSKSISGMGFRDLQKFNNAMLAKQVWRLIHDKDTLVYKVLVPNIFLNLMLLSIQRVLTRGKVLCRHVRSFIRTQYEGLGMAKQLRSRTINGCLDRGVVKLYLLEWVLLWLRSVSCFIQILESGIQVN